MSGELSCLQAAHAKGQDSKQAIVRAKSTGCFVVAGSSEIAASIDRGNFFSFDLV